MLNGNQRVRQFMQQDAAEDRQDDDRAEDDAGDALLRRHAPLVHYPEHDNRKRRMDHHVDALDRTDPKRSSHEISPFFSQQDDSMTAGGRADAGQDSTIIADVTGPVTNKCSYSLRGTLFA